MDCVGIVMDIHTCRAVFNHQLAMAKATDLLAHHKKGAGNAPLVLQTKIQAELRRMFPALTVKFVDAASELEVEVPEGDYILTLVQEAPVYSGSMH